MARTHNTGIDSSTGGRATQEHDRDVAHQSAVRSERQLRIVRLPIEHEGIIDTCGVDRNE